MEVMVIMAMNLLVVVVDFLIMVVDLLVLSDKGILVVFFFTLV